MLYVLHTNSEIAGVYTTRPVVPEGFLLSELPLTTFTPQEVMNAFQVWNGQIVPKCHAIIAAQAASVVVADGVNQCPLTIAIRCPQGLAGHGPHSEVVLVVNGQRITLRLGASQETVYPFSTSTPGIHELEIPSTSSLQGARWLIRAVRP